ncbi:hypothetical protein CALVIDRAFT_596981 [Calocera viscosa TUFC12733]|uniref:Uncharacterized protein n=1 Tax=Calocera viscosa (strain TUFC12733) TaxID=1330018 RepID=A0A167NQX5_CALVF|nr:hypothetical protein CALVIDRAFT_596981 [Calocera viscosa TUFC12733]
MGEEKVKTTKSLKRSRTAQDMVTDAPTPKRTALTPADNSAKRVSTKFRAPAFTRPGAAPTSPAPPSSESTAVDATETPVKTTHKKAITEKGKGKDPEPTPGKAKENMSSAAKQHKRAINAPFVPPKIKNPAAAIASSSTAVVARISSFGPPPELSLVEKRDLLKRAARVTKEDDVTRELITKWRAAGREVATDLYKLVSESGMLEVIEESKKKQSEEKNNGGFGGGSWGFGLRIQSRFETSWGWMDPQTKPESGWGWASVNEHMSEGEGREAEYAEEDNEDREEELPSAERLKKDLEVALNQPYKKRESLLPLGGSDAYYDAAGEAAIRAQIEALETKEEKKSWGVGRMLDEFGIPQTLFGWDDETEDWKDED